MHLLCSREQMEVQPTLPKWWKPDKNSDGVQDKGLPVKPTVWFSHESVKCGKFYFTYLFEWFFLFLLFA